MTFYVFELLHTFSRHGFWYQSDQT